MSNFRRRWRLGPVLTTIVIVATAGCLSGCTADKQQAPEPSRSPLVQPNLVTATDFAGTFLVQSLFRGAGECLDPNYLNATPAHGGAYMAACSGQADQNWTLAVVAPALYQIRSTSADGAICLNGNDSTSPVHDGAAFAEPCRLITDQVWSVEVQDDGRLRLHSQLYSDGYCLESNDKDSTAHAGSTFMDKCANVSGQLWSLNPVKSPAASTTAPSPTTSRSTG